MGQGWGLHAQEGQGDVLGGWQKCGRGGADPLAEDTWHGAGLGFDGVVEGRGQGTGLKFRVCVCVFVGGEQV